MSLYLAEKYLRIISPRLLRFKEKGNHVWNCRCPVCGDSKKKSTIARGYFTQKMGALNYYCHNCSASMSFGYFLKWFDNNLYQEYSLETFKERMHKDVAFIEKEKEIPATHKYIPDIFSSLPLVRTVAKNSLVYKFCTKRKLPIETFEIYYADKFIEWTKSNTDKFKDFDVKEDHPRIVLPFKDRNGMIFGYTARALDDTQKQKYYRIFVDDTVKEKFFGMDRLDDNKQIYVLEGEIDSLMIPNAIAVSNGKLHSYLNKNAIYIPDCDIRNKQIMKNVSDMIKLGLKVCMMPPDLPGKDLNELVKQGWTSKELIDIINSNTYEGLAAQLKFNTWKIT